MGSKPSANDLLEPAPLDDLKEKVWELASAGSWPADLSFCPIDGSLIDSASATPHDWLRAREVLKREWPNFEGFVVIHGTDTMPYLAAFLSFAIEHQDKPVVVTGSMKPIFQDGDAATNLAASVRAAAAKSIDGGLLDQVLICFGGRILRGNRATKIGSGEAAIDTPRVSDLGYFDIDGKFCGMLSWRPGQPRRVVSTGKHVRFLKVENSRVALVRLFPGISSETVKAMLADCSGAVIEAYGSGTGPKELRACLEELADNGMFIVVTTEVVWGGVEVGTYATDLVRTDGPLISGGRLWAETALAKLYYLLGIADRSRNTWRKWVKDEMQKSIRGDAGEF